MFEKINPITYTSSHNYTIKKLWGFTLLQGKLTIQRILIFLKWLDNFLRKTCRKNDFRQGCFAAIGW